MLHTTLEFATLAAFVPIPTPEFDVERINYDRGLNGRMTVAGYGGDDLYFSDDTSAIATLDGGTGDDFFQIGQLFGTKRDGLIGNVAPEDVFAVIPTTRGWLSPGNHEALLVQGGEGDDRFAVFGNGAPVHLVGGGGDDEFVVRSFALAETTGNCDGPAGVNDPTCQIL